MVPFGDDYLEVLLDNAKQFTQHILTFGERQVPLTEAGLDVDSIAELGLTVEDTILLMGDVFADDVEVGNSSTFSLNFNFEIDEIESQAVTLQFAGEHNIGNALAAATCAHALGLGMDEIAKGLDEARPAKGRLNFSSFGNHTLIDDTYNANPSAVLAAANVLIQQDGYKILVLGDIGELGDDAVPEHEKLGEQLAELPIDRLLVVGELMAHTAAFANSHANTASSDFAQHFANKTELVNFLKPLMQTQDCTVLVKGSRYMAMETVLNDLTSQLS